MENYLIVLFKNKTKCRIIKKFVTFDKARQTYKKLLSESNEVIFEINVENGNQVNYELAIVDLKNDSKFPTYKKDSLGRTQRVQINESNMSILEICDYKKEERIFDLQNKKRITINEFIKSYLKKDELKIVSVINNKIVVQQDEIINLFSLKTENETIRFIETLSKKFITENRSDCIFVPDVSTPQRKYLLNLLSTKGYSKQMLYKNVTTFPRPVT